MTSLIQDLSLFTCRIVYTADDADDKATILKSIHSMSAASKGNANRHFDNINYEEHKHVEYDEDDDERSPVIVVVNGDVVWVEDKVLPDSMACTNAIFHHRSGLSDHVQWSTTFLSPVSGLYSLSF